MKRAKRYVFDSYAIIAYLEGERGSDIVADILMDALSNKAEIYMSVINWGEVYYIVLREQGESAASLYLQTIGRYPITIIDAGGELTLQAAKIKAFNKMSYADSFAVALTKKEKARLVTGDKKFAPFESELNIVWL